MAQGSSIGLANRPSISPVKPQGHPPARMPPLGCSRLVAQARQKKGDNRRRQEEEPGVEQGGAIIANRREQAKEYRAKGSGDATDVVAKPRPRGAEQRGEKGWQIHGEEGKGTLAKPDQREPAQQGDMVAPSIAKKYIRNMPTMVVR